MRNLPVMLKLSAAIISFGGIRQHFNYQGWIQDSIIRSCGELWWPADDRQIRISTKSGCFDFDSKISVKSHTTIVEQAISELSSEIGSNQAVLQRAAGHRKHLTVKELALEIGGALD